MSVSVRTHLHHLTLVFFTFLYISTQRSRLITEVATAKETKHSHLTAYTAHFKHRGDVKEIFGFGKSPVRPQPSAIHAQAHTVE